MLMPMLWNSDFDVMDPFDTADELWNGFWGNESESGHAMRCDVVEKDGAYEVKADLPGFNKEDVHVDLKDGVLTIGAEHKDNSEQKDEKSGKVLRRERHYSSYQRSFNVGEDVKAEEITAKYENGVLTLNLPKKEQIPEKKEDVKRIAIQ